MYSISQFAKLNKLIGFNLKSMKVSVKYFKLKYAHNYEFISIRL